ncbi:MAG: tetratricopeptide repeat protein [Acidimicrobiia bacterium]
MVTTSDHRLRDTPSPDRRVLRQLEVVEAAIAAGDERRAFEELDRGASTFVELGFDLPLDRLEDVLRRLEQLDPENPWVLFYLAWVWSTRRRHTLALVTLRRADQQFRARWDETIPAGRRVRFLVKMAEGVILEREGILADARLAFNEAIEWSDGPPTDRVRSEDEERWIVHDPSGMFAFWLAALDLYRHNGLTFSTARAYHNLGTRLLDRGEPVPSLQFLEKAYELKLGGTNLLSLANTLNSLGHTERHAGLVDRASRHLEEAIELATRVEHDTTLSYSLNNLGEVRREQRRFKEALDLYRNSMDLKARAENVFGLAHSLASRADLHLFAGDPVAARRDADEAVRLRVPSPDPLENVRLTLCQARAHLSSGDTPSRVAERIESTLETLVSHDAKGELAIATWWLAAIRLMTEEHAQALDLVDSTLRLVGRHRLEHVLAPHVAFHPELLELGLADPQSAEVAQNLADLTRRGDQAPAAETAPRLTAHLFGELRLSLDGGEVPLGTWRSKKAVSLLAMLLHHRGDPVHREQAMEALWPEGDPDRSSKNLNVALTATRRGLEQAHPRGSKCLRRQGAFYRIVPDSIEWLDVVEFLDMANEAATLAGNGDLEGGERAAHRALELATDEYLASEHYADWVIIERARLGEVAADLCVRSAEWLLALDRVDEALARAQEALARQPLRERAWLVVMRAHLARGDRVAALNAFDECTHRFSVELGVDPSAELRQLVAFLRR